MAYDGRRWVGETLRNRRRSRRAPWTIGFGVLASATLAAVALSSPRHLPLGQAVWCLALPILFCTVGSPFARETWLTSVGRATYDEFERDALRRATQGAYAAFLLLVVLLFGGLCLADAAGWPHATGPAAWATLGFAAAGIGAALPVLFAELIVPFPPLDDIDEEPL